MRSPVVSSQLHGRDLDAVQVFINVCAAEIGYRPVSDQAWADLTHGADGSMVSVRILDDASQIVGYAHAVADGAAWTAEAAFATHDVTRLAWIARQCLAALVSAVLSNGGGELTWVVQGPTALHDEVAGTFGLSPERRLHQMRRSLPSGTPTDIVTRPFDVDRDLTDWVGVNARAFAWNAEQGSWTAANVLARMDEDWFDPRGFLVHERDGRMAGFCWTKIHASVTPRLGEIYVIAVDPDFHGLGLGRALVQAGLDWLAGCDVTVGMLFVDADNVAAVRLYDTMGFVIHRTDCIYHGIIAHTPVRTGESA